MYDKTYSPAFTDNKAEDRSRNKACLQILFLFLVSVFFAVALCLPTKAQDNEAKPGEGEEKDGPLEVPRSPEEEAIRKNSEQEAEQENNYDKVIMKDGSVIKGKVVDPGGPTIRVEQKLGAVSVLKSRIKDLVLNENREWKGSGKDVVHLKTGETIKGRVESAEDGNELVITIKKDGEEHRVKLPREDVLKIEYAKGTREELEERIISFKDPLASVVEESVEALASEDTETRRKAETKLKNLGVFAIDYLKEMLPDLEEPSLSMVKDILRISEIKSYISPGAVETLDSVIYETLVSGEKEKKQEVIKQLILLEEDGAVPLLSFIAKSRYQEIEVRNFALHSLASVEANLELLELMSEAEENDGWLRLACALHLSDNGINVGAVHFISALRMRDPGIRQMAAEKLREVSGRNFGFEPVGTESEREEAIKKWEEWWKEKSPEIMQQSAKQLGSVTTSEDDKSFSELYRKRGHNSWDKGKLEEASENFKKALELDPMNLSARLSLAVLLYSELGITAQARSELELVLNRYGKEAGPLVRKLGYYHLALVDLSEDKWEPALHNLQAAIGLDGRFTDGYIALGKTYYLQAVNDETISRETILSLPESERAEVEKRRDDIIERSIRAFEIGLGLLDEDIGEYTGIDFRKKRREAERDIEKRIGPRFGSDEEDMSEAELKEALLVKKASAYAMLADSYGLRLEWRKAARCLSDAVRLDDSEPEYLCRLGMALAAAGKNEEAREAFERCLKLEPDNSMAKEGLNNLR